MLPAKAYCPPSFAAIARSWLLAVMAVFFWKRATKAGGLSSICAGTLVAVVWKIAGFSLPMIFPALAASLACLIGVSLLTPPPREEQWRPFFGGQESRSQ